MINPLYLDVKFKSNSRFNWKDPTKKRNYKVRSLEINKRIKRHDTTHTCDERGLLRF